MLGSLTPLGERGRNSAWAVTVTFYVVASALAGSLAGWTLGFLGAAPVRLLRDGVGDWAPAALLGAAVAVGLVLDVRLFGLSLPTVKRQVSQAWLRQFRGWVYGLGFGFQLGLGVVTIVTTSAVYTTLLAALLSGSATAGLVIGAAFGILRGAAVLAVARVRTFDQYSRIDPLLKVWDRPARRASLALQAALALSLVLVSLVL